VTLWLARHAAPLVAPGICYGALDVPADPTATQTAASELAHTLPEGLLVRFSPLARCAQLAQDLRDLRSDLHFESDVRLAEMNFGCYEGIAWDAIALDALREWTDDFGQHRFGGSESANMVMERVASAWDTLDTASSQVWLTHAGVIRAAVLISQGLRNVQSANQWPKEAPAFGRWITLEPGPTSTV
jgi:alpha-ribazole phosphatase